MPEQTTAATTTDDGTTITDPAATFDQADVDRIVAERLARERAKIGDVKALKAAADELAAIKESQKSEAQKTADRIAAAEAEVASVPAKVADALKEHLVALHKIPADDAELFLTASDPALLLKQVERLVARGVDAAAAERKNGNRVPREGATTTPAAEGGMREFTRHLFGGDPT